MSSLKKLFSAKNGKSEFLSTVTELNKNSRGDTNSDSAPVITFSNGKECPQLGLGTYKLNNATTVIKEAINIGYRHFDCAHVYKNEEEVGVGIREAIEASLVKREDLFITSKLWNTNHRKDLVVPALKKSLQRLDLQYLDLYLIHWPMGFQEGNAFYPIDEKGTVQYSQTKFVDTWMAMEECVKLGLTRSIGLSNFNSKQIEMILKNCNIKPVNNQIECHPYLNQAKLIEYCRQNDITVTAYSPLGSPSRPLPTEDLTRVFEDKRVLEIAAKYFKSPAQILIRYQLERGVIVIPKSGDKVRLRINYDALSFRLDENDLNILNNMEHPNGRMIPFTDFQDHKDYPFNIEF